MGITKKHVQGCRCCQCLLIAHNGSTTSPFTECSGTWTAGSATNSRRTSSSNAKILFDRPFNGAAGWEATVSVKIKASVANVPFDLRLIGANEDAGSGYCSANGVYTIFQGVSNGKYLKLHDGTQHPWDTTSCTADSGITTSELLVTLTLCWDGTTLTASTGASQPNIIASTITAPIGDKFGFATGTLDANITYVEFYDFTLYRVSSSCETCIRHCCGEEVPAQLVVEISGVTGASLEFLASPFNCTLNDCGIFDGTYLLDASASAFSTDCAGDGSCQWVYRSVTISTSDMTCSSSPGAQQVKVEAAITVVGSTRNIGVTIDTATRFLSFSGSFTGICSDELADWLALTGHAAQGGFDPFYCDGTTATTARIKIN